MNITQKRKLIFVKLAVITFGFSLALIGFHNFYARFTKTLAASSGPTPGHTGAPGEANCTACHSDFSVNSGTGNVSITGLPANYLPNRQIPVTVTINQLNAVVFGFQLTAVDSQGRRIGTYTLPAQTPQQLQVVNGQIGGRERSYVQHTNNGITPTQFDTKSWTFTFNTPPQRAGKITFYAAGNAANSDRDSTGDYIYSTSKSTLSGSAISNFDGDILSDVAVFRPSNGVWYTLGSANGGFQGVGFGTGGDKIVPGDYDADGKTDFAVFRPSTGTWFILRSSDGGFSAISFGTGEDIPVSGDFDGDLKTDVAVFRPSNGVWYILRSSDGAFDFRQFGIAADKPAQGDYDGDGKTDIAVWRPENGVWYIWKSSDGGFIFTGFGTNGDKPVQADYDGDGKTDLGVFRPSGGTWFLLQSSNGFAAAQFGITTDKPVPADYDGDGKSDIAVFRDGVWFILRSSNGSFFAVSFGTSGDAPVPGGYIAE
jgi:hypothetical protein